MTNLIVCIDYLSRWVEVSPVTDVATENVLTFLRQNIFSRHGVPKRMISDQGSGFTSRECAEFIRKWRVDHIFASGEHPETNGLVEKANGTLTATLAAFVNFQHTDWDEKVAEAAFCINTAKQSSTEISPFELVYARHATLSQDLAFPWPPSDEESYEDRRVKIVRWRKTARDLVIKSQRRSKDYCDKYRKADPIFQPGDLVLVARHRRAEGRTKKFNPRFIGPYQIIKKVAATCYMIEDLTSNRRRRLWRRFKVHSSQIRRYHPRREMDWSPENNISDCGDDKFVTTSEETGPLELAFPASLEDVPLRSSSNIVAHAPFCPESFQSPPDVVNVPVPDFVDNPARATVTRSNRLSRPRADNSFLYY